MSKSPDKRMAAYIPIDVYSLGVAVFRNEKRRAAVLRDQGCDDIADGNPAALASAYRDYANDGTVRLSMVLKRGTTRATWAHECVHIADFVMDHVGIPLGIDNTEVRAYLVGHLFAHLDTCEALQ